MTSPKREKKIERLPPWLRASGRFSPQVHRIKRILRSHGLHTVCESARCPNIGECFCRPTATFMIMGDVCTRSCAFCAVKHGRPDPLDPAEPEKLADAVDELGLEYVVITSVTRDDLPDGGADHFAKVVAAVKRRNPKIGIEVLTPDFLGDRRALDRLADAPPEVFNHNVETVPRLYSRIRPQANYRRSLDLLIAAGKAMPDTHTKSGLMVGLGETCREVISVMEDLRDSGCEILTVGQYMRPRLANVAVAEYVEPAVFEQYEQMGRSLDFACVHCGPLVRSSYHAGEIHEKMKRSESPDQT